MGAINHQIKGLSNIFTQEELLSVGGKKFHILSILSYFATSLFDKNKVDDVLWDIVENCISILELEDCVIYMFDESRQVLFQKAAFGHKSSGKRKILSPIIIPLGQGIVGSVALSGKPEIVDDVSRDHRYICDDIQRRSELAVPIMSVDKVIGVIDSEHSQKSFFNDDHLFLFELIAQLTSKKLAHVMKPSRSRGAFTADNAYFKRFCFLLEKEKIFKDKMLSLSMIAEQLNVSANYLSQLINKLSKSSFSELINRYRVDEAKKCLSHPDYNNYTVAGIGFESGFNSTSAFYDAFKKHTGMTPSEYRCQIKLKANSA